MAFHKLCALALVVGASLAGACGGTSGKVAYDPGTDDAPNNAGDRPPLSSDQPVSNSDRPPTSTERPPLNGDSPGGGRLQEVCDKFCAVVDRCDVDMGDLDAGDLCGMGFCTIPAGVQVQVPCIDEVLGLFDCALSLPNLCADDDSAQGKANEARCSGSIDSFTECVDKNYEPPGKSGPDQGAGDPPIVSSCTPTGGCKNCMSDCLACYCQIADDPTPDQTQCLDICTGGQAP